MRKMSIIYPKCEECGFEFEVEWDHVTNPTANGYEPDDGDAYGWVWRNYHGPKDCNSSLTIERSDFDNEQDAVV